MIYGAAPAALLIRVERGRVGLALALEDFQPQGQLVEEHAGNARAEPRVCLILDDHVGVLAGAEGFFAAVEASAGGEECPGKRPPRLLDGPLPISDSSQEGRSGKRWIHIVGRTGDRIRLSPPGVDVTASGHYLNAVCGRNQRKQDGRLVRRTTTDEASVLQMRAWRAHATD